MNLPQVVAATSHRDSNRNPIFRQMPSRAPADRSPRPSRSCIRSSRAGVACLACRESEGATRATPNARRPSATARSRRGVVPHARLHEDRHLRQQRQRHDRTARDALRWNHATGHLSPSSIARCSRVSIRSCSPCGCCTTARRAVRGSATIDCVDARDFGIILGSMRSGARIYLDARRRMRETLRPLGATFPDPPAVSPTALRPRDSS
jgi:hypothetical protein